MWVSLSNINDTSTNISKWLVYLAPLFQFLQTLVSPFPFSATGPTLLCESLRISSLQLASQIEKRLIQLVHWPLQYAQWKKRPDKATWQAQQQYIERENGSK
jgi:hypothetical protein